MATKKRKPIAWTGTGWVIVKGGKPDRPTPGSCPRVWTIEPGSEFGPPLKFGETAAAVRVTVEEIEA